MLGFAATTDTVKAEAGTIAVENAWARATPKGAKVAAGYLTIDNVGGEPDRLVSASAAFAGKTELHQSSMTGGVMKMRPVTGGLAIPPQGTVTLAPGSYHLMFMNLAAPLAAGDTVRGQLVFERAGAVEVEFKVLGMGAQGPGEDAQHHKH